MTWLGNWNNNLYHGILNCIVSHLDSLKISLDLIPTDFFLYHMACTYGLSANDEKLKSGVWYIKITVLVG